MIHGAFLGWVSRHGALGLFSLLVLGVFGFPLPDETLLAFAGFLAYRGEAALPAVMVAAFAGSCVGITFTYALGRLLGRRRIVRFASRFGLTEVRLDAVHRWFDRWGKWTLLVGFFVPTFRHLNALVAGTSHLRPAVFATFAWTGALLWSQTFVLLGYAFGEEWHLVAGFVSDHTTEAYVLAGVVVAALIGFRLWRRRRRA